MGSFCLVRTGSQSERRRDVQLENAFRPSYRDQLRQCPMAEGRTQTVGGITRHVNQVELLSAENRRSEKCPTGFFQVVHTLWRRLQLVVSTENAPTLSLWVWTWSAERCYELGLLYDLAKTVRVLYMIPLQEATPELSFDMSCNHGSPTLPSGVRSCLDTTRQ